MTRSLTWPRRQRANSVRVVLLRERLERVDQKVCWVRTEHRLRAKVHLRSERRAASGRCAGRCHRSNRCLELVKARSTVLGR